ncbi:unnamed protein product [Rhizophagus irregularis]|nr:unnamed protein product [Rhizophagus irregularis]
MSRENLNKNLSDCNENQSNQDYETSDNEDELVELTDSLELIAGLTFNSWDEFKSWINRFALKEGFSYKIRSSEKIEDAMPALQKHHALENLMLPVKNKWCYKDQFF